MILVSGIYIEDLGGYLGRDNGLISFINSVAKTSDHQTRIVGLFQP